MGRTATKKENPEKEGAVNATPVEEQQMNSVSENPAAEDTAPARPSVSASVSARAIPARNNRAETIHSAAMNDDTVIEVKSLVPDVYYACPNTHDPFAWVAVRDIQEMTCKQLKIMRAKYPRYFTEKRLLPLNAQAMKKLNLERVFGTKLTISEKTKLFKNDVEAVEDLLSGLNAEGRSELTQYVIKSAKEGKLVNVKIMNPYEHPVCPDRSLMYSKIFPYAYTPEAEKDTDTFICFRLHIPEVLNKTFKQMRIVFYIYTHQSNIRTSDGLRPDLIAERIDHLFNGTLDMGVGRMRLENIDDISPSQNFHGLALEYSVSEFNRPTIKGDPRAGARV